MIIKFCNWFGDVVLPWFSTYTEVKAALACVALLCIGYFIAWFYYRK